MMAPQSTDVETLCMYRPYIEGLARQYSRYCGAVVGREDLEQAGWAGLYEGIRTGANYERSIVLGMVAALEPEGYALIDFVPVPPFRSIHPDVDVALDARSLR